ncbi:MAG: ZIP family metal transporter [Candidatus Omnitrophica bacterium]|nr:ZIP family metal transporter [Candidatus Omnitrophota bacterium]
MKHILLIVLLIFVGQTLGSLIGLLKRPKETFLYASLAFSASMMLGISFFQLMPEAFKIMPFYLVIVSFLAGIAIMQGVDYALPHINPGLFGEEKPSFKKAVSMLVTGIALHNLPEGLAIGVGFALRPELGIMIAMGIAAQDVPENIATIVPLYGLTKERMKSFIIISGTILFEVFGFIIGYYFLKGSSLILLGASLSLAAGFMTYISIDELIPAAKIRENPKITAASLTLGAICALAISF